MNTYAKLAFAAPFIFALSACGDSAEEPAVVETAIVPTAEPLPMDTATPDAMGTETPAPMDGATPMATDTMTPAPTPTTSPTM